MRDFHQEIIDIVGSGGEDCCIIAPGDPRYENAAHTTFVTKGQGALDNLTFTLSEARTAFDNVATFPRNRYKAALQPFNGTDEDADTPDAAPWSRDDSMSEGFSLGGLVTHTGSAFEAAFGKNDGVSREEWYWRFNTTGNVQLRIKDESENVEAVRLSSGGLITGNLPQFVLSTYDGGGGDTAADGINHYIRGVLRNGSATNNASYVAMEDTDSLVELGTSGGLVVFFGGSLGTLFFTHRVLNAAEALNLADIYKAMQEATPSRILAGVL